MSIKRQSRKVGVAGGFINQMMGNNSTLPVVGEGATILSYSDREAYEVIEVSDDSSKCVIRQMNCKHVGVAYGDEQYTYSSDVNNNTLAVAWNEKKSKWGVFSTKVEIQKSVANKLIKEYGFGWSDYLPVPYDELVDGEKDGMYTKLKLVKGITKEYTSFYPLSIIFGVMEQYRDPSF